MFPNYILWIAWKDAKARHPQLNNVRILKKVRGLLKDKSNEGFFSLRNHALEHSALKIYSVNRIIM